MLYRMSSVCSLNTVIFQKISQHLRLRLIVYRHYFKLFIIKDLSEGQPSYPAKSIDCNFDTHFNTLLILHILFLDTVQVSFCFLNSM